MVALIPTYTLSGDALTTAKTAFETAANEILAGLDDSMSDLKKELYLHDTLAARVTYEESTHAHDAYGALVEGVAVCEGYAESFQYLLHRAGIRSFIALGNSKGGPHAWNYVEIGGEFYHVDLTWNDQDDSQYHEFFNQTDAVIQESHTIDTAAYPLPECDSQTDDFTVEDGKGYGKLSGEITASVEPGEGYVKITEADGISFHKVELTIQSMVLRSEVSGLYFKSVFDGDELVAQHVDGFGVALSVTGIPDETTLENPDFFTRFDKELFGSDTDNTSTLLTGIMKAGNGYNTNRHYASMTVYGRTYIEVDGEMTFGQPRSRSLQDQVERIDNLKWGQLSTTQKQALLGLYSRFEDVMSEWMIPNIKAS